MRATGEDRLTPSTWPCHLPVQAVLQPGSKAGFYTQKSPKMLLLEWTQQQKRLKPRYKTLRTDEGSFRCKVRAEQASKHTGGHIMPGRPGLQHLHGSLAQCRPPGRSTCPCCGLSQWAASAELQSSRQSCRDLWLTSSVPASCHIQCCEGPSQHARNCASVATC